MIFSPLQKTLFIGFGVVISIGLAWLGILAGIELNPFYQ